MGIEDITKAAAFLRQTFGDAPDVAIVLGSGLAPLADELKNSKKLLVKDIPGGTSSHVIGHRGELVVGTVGSRRVVAMSGRIHGYEGHSPERVVHVVRSLKTWGVNRFILTNAAGSVKKSVKPATLVLLKDHLNLTGQNPLTGLELYNGPRFPDMTDCYTATWRKDAKKIASKLKLKVAIKEGVYVGLMGPNYESAAEIRMLNKMGADVVGMSTVWEALALRQMGASILGISCVSNYGTGILKAPLDHKEVLEVAQKVSKDFIRWLTEILSKGNLP